MPQIGKFFLGTSLARKLYTEAYSNSYQRISNLEEIRAASAARTSACQAECGKNIRKSKLQLMQMINTLLIAQRFHHYNLTAFCTVSSKDFKESNDICFLGFVGLKLHHGNALFCNLIQ
jgi:hypothetical protein